MSLEQALADLKAATTVEHLGREHLLDGVAVVCVVRSLRLEEAQSFAAEGLVTKALRITAEAGALPYLPRFGTEINLDGEIFTVKQVHSIGTLVRIVIERYQV